MHPIFERTFRALRAWPQGGGLEISDTVLRFAEWKSGAWRTAAFRLPPGVMQEGRILDRDKCREAFSAFRAEITGEPGARSTVAVAVAVSSANVYTQAFVLPRVEGANLAEALELNLQMASPFEAGAAYMSSQAIGSPAPGSLTRGMLGAFVDRALADDLIAVLTAAGFVPRSLESGALALARTARERGAGIRRDGASLILTVNENGFEFLLLEEGDLAFQYFTPWRDLQGDAKEVPWETFSAELLRSLRQVLNYAGAHRKEPVTEIFLAAGDLAEGVTNIITSRGGLAVRPLALGADAATLGPEWFVVAGAGLRGMIPPREDRGVSLLGVTAREEFWRYEITRFLRFWRILFPVTLLVLLAMGIAVDVFLVRERRAIEREARDASRADRAAAIAALERAAAEFNRSVEFVLAAVGNREPKSAVVGDLRELLAKRSITLVRVDLGAAGAVALAAYAPSEADIRGLAEDLRATGRFADVNVPFETVKPEGQGFSFSLSARRAPASASSSISR